MSDQTTQSEALLSETLTLVRTPGTPAPEPLPALDTVIATAVAIAIDRGQPFSTTDILTDLCNGCPDVVAANGEKMARLGFTTKIEEHLNAVVEDGGVEEYFTKRYGLTWRPPARVTQSERGA